MKLISSVFAMMLLLVSCAEASVKTYRLEVVAEYPHDTSSYTQGLFFNDGDLYESTGTHGKSTFRKVDLYSRVLASYTKATLDSHVRI